MLEVILEHLLSQWQFQNHQQNQPSKVRQTRTKRITREVEADEWLIKRNDCKINTTLLLTCKLGCVVRMVIDSILSHTESGPNDHRLDSKQRKITYHLRKMNELRNLF